MTDLSCTNDIVIAVVALIVAATTLINMVVAARRHANIMSDNKRLLHVIEGKTATVSDVRQ